MSAALISFLPSLTPESPGVTQHLGRRLHLTRPPPPTLIPGSLTRAHQPNRLTKHMGYPPWMSPTHNNHRYPHNIAIGWGRSEQAAEEDAAAGERLGPGSGVPTDRQQPARGEGQSSLERKCLSVSASSPINLAVSPRLRTKWTNFRRSCSSWRTILIRCRRLCSPLTTTPWRRTRLWPM